MRTWLVPLHRWLGLATAAFLFVAGATGALIAWDHEIDGWLNPAMHDARSAGPARDPVALAARLEADDPRVRVRFVPLATLPGEALSVFLEPRTDAATGRPHEPGYNQVALDPATGEVQARREWGRVSLTREHLMPFLYKLHYSLHLPTAGGFDTGVWLMGLVGIAWVLDTLVALWISFPSARQWRRSFAFRWRDGGHRLTFDLHRSGAMWVYPLLLVLAVTSVAMNLREPVVRPVVSWFSTLAPSPFAAAPAALPGGADTPLAQLAPQVIATATAEARRRGIEAPAGGLFRAADFGVWGVGFYTPERSHGDGSLGNPWIYVDATGRQVLGADVPGRGSAGDLFLQSMFPLHSGRIAGVPGRVLVSALGVGVATLSVTGVLLWARKRRARAAAAAARPARGAATAT